MKVHINDMIVAGEAAKQGVTMGEDTVTGLIFADNLVGIFRNTRRIAETDRESPRVHYEKESDSEREKTRSK